MLRARSHQLRAAVRRVDPVLLDAVLNAARTGVHCGISEASAAAAILRQAKLDRNKLDK